MNPDIQRAITKAWGELQALGVEHLDVFGSEARGSATPESDVDVPVYFRGPATLRQLVALRDRLEALLGRKVDLVTPRALCRAASPRPAPPSPLPRIDLPPDRGLVESARSHSRSPT